MSTPKNSAWESPWDKSNHEPAEPVAANQEIELGCAHGCTNSQVAKQCPIHVVERITKLVADSGPRIDTSRVPHGLSNLPPEQITAHKGVYVPDIDRDPSSPATSQPVVISTVFKAPAEKDSSRCSLDGAPRIPLNREGTKFGACTLVNGKDGTGGCKDPLHDYEIEQQSPAVEPQKQYNIIRGQQKVSLEVDQPHDTKTHAIPEAGSTRPEMPPSLPRIETGNVQFDNDWPGVFFRGDTAINIARQLRLATSNGKKVGFERLASLIVALEDCHVELDHAIQHVKRAASVQQEPLSAEPKTLAREIADNIACLFNGDLRYGKNIREIAENVLSSKSAAPRTQGRELTCEFDFGRYSYCREHSGGTTNDCPKCKERNSILHLAYSAGLEKEGLAQARTQLAPKCPKCGGKVYVQVDTLDPSGGSGYCKNKACCFTGKFAQFFTALPEISSSNQD